MSSTLTASGINFNDGTTNNGNVRNDIGSLFYNWTGISVTPGNTTAGSNITYDGGSAGLSGTWRNHGYNVNATGAQIYTRVS
jgi:hypothetical protein